jgi:cell wall-associated NlpC family hydrolase
MRACTNVTSSWTGFGIRIGMMRIPLRTCLIVSLLCGLGLGVALAQTPQTARNSKTARQASNHERKANRTLTADEGLSVIAAALDRKVRLHPGRDCSHLVHAIYERAGFPYSYASSDDLYEGVEGFQRVAEPQPGDIIVWRGHAGIVVRPSRHIFFSFMSAGPGIDDYKSSYWSRRGWPRFYRYVNNPSSLAKLTPHNLRP